MCNLSALMIIITLLNGSKIIISYAQDINLNNCSSSCGNIPITFPFQLQTDSPNCGRGLYNLSCKNNLTFYDAATNPYSASALGNNEYRVQSINYQNYTIRLSAITVQDDNCSSIPTQPMSSSDFQISGDWNDDLGYSKIARQISETITFLSCRKQVRDNPSYIDTSVCINGSDFSPENKGTNYSTKGRNYSYAVYGNNFKFSDLEESCQTYHTLLVSPPTRSIKSVKDIYNAIVYGFEISYKNNARICYYYDLFFGMNAQYCITSIPLLTRIKLIWFQVYHGLANDYNSIFGKFLPKVNPDAGPPTYGIEFPLIVLLTPRTIVGIAFVISVIIYKWKRRHSSSYINIEEFLQSHNNLMPIRYKYSEVKKMSYGFKTKLGEGGFGSVYKGKLRSGRFVAIKMLGKSNASGQDFINEVTTIGTIHHVNVVRLIGFCVEGSKRALVYEFMPNGSLDKFIFSKDDQGTNRCYLSSKEIHEISLGISRGIEYLHRGCDMRILHFDIKPHNILLDENFSPKVSDFGLARLCPSDDSIMSLTAARGTIGYIAPELFYKNIGGVSDKADVYSFGMLLMEMAHRRRNVNANAANSSQIFFPTWVHSQVSEGKDLDIVEGETEEESKTTRKMIIVALWCIQLKPCDRPSMRRVIEMLEREVESLEMPPKPMLFPQFSNINNAEDCSSDSASNATSSSSFSQSELYGKCSISEGKKKV